MIRMLLAASLVAASLFAQAGLKVREWSKIHRENPCRKLRSACSGRMPGAPIRTSTNEEGRFSFERLAAGSFLLQIDKESFQSATRNVELKGGDIAAEVVLQVAGVSDSILVTAVGSAAEARRGLQGGQHRLPGGD